MLNFSATEMTWYFNRKEIKATQKMVISTHENKSSIKIENIALDNVGFYSCKAENEVGQAVTLGKVEIASSQPMHGNLPQKSITPSNVKLEKSLNIEVKLITKVDNQIIEKEVHLIKGDRCQKGAPNLRNLANDTEIATLFDQINVDNYGPGLETIKDLTIIGYLMQQGSGIDDIKNIYNTDGFTALKQPESQFALVQLIEREGHGKLITDILIAEHIADDNILASTVGFLAFLKMIELKHTTVENFISLLCRDDFTRQEWKSIEGKEVQTI